MQKKLGDFGGFGPVWDEPWTIVIHSKKLFIYCFKNYSFKEIISKNLFIQKN